MFSLFSQKSSNAKNTQRVVFTITGMHCVSCSMNIDGELEDTPGIISAKTSYAKATCEVEYDPAKISAAQMQQKIKELGYDLTPVS